MDMDKVKENMIRWKATAELFLRDDKRVFIKDTSDNIYFADIILVGEDTITIQCFGPEQRRGEKFTLYWPLIIHFEEFRS